MKHEEWARQTGDRDAARRAGGRARYNAERARAAEERRRHVGDLLARHAGEPDQLALVATLLGISRATLWRDRQAIADWRATLDGLAFGSPRDEGEGA